MEVLFAPLDWRPDLRTSLQPDVLVLAIEDIERRRRGFDDPGRRGAVSVDPAQGRCSYKRSKYEDSGVASYWIVDPEAPSITALELVDGRYVTVGEAIGDQALTVEKPFPVTIVPSAWSLIRLTVTAWSSARRR